jgi:hypothetical protein
MDNNQTSLLTVMNDQQNAAVLHHIAHIKSRLQELMDHLRKDETKVDDPKARALFETSAETLAGLLKAFTDFEQGTPATEQEPGKAETHWPEQEQPLK